MTDLIMWEDRRVYFIEAPAVGYVKIGYTKRNVEDRMKAIQLKCPHKLRLLFSHKYTEVMNEKHLWNRFKHLRVKRSSWSREWFVFDDSIRNFIESML